MNSTATASTLDELKEKFKLKQGAHAASVFRSGSSFDVGAYLAQYGVEHTVKEKAGATLYCLKTCLFDPTHGGNESAVIQGADGKLRYQCFHNSCKGKTWHEAREKISGTDGLGAFCGNGTGSDGAGWEMPRTEPSQAAEWPDSLAAHAFHGLTGELVNRIAPHTEADKAALLFQFLAATGNAIGSGAHFFADGTRHSLVLFVLLIGATAKGRKGTSLTHVFSRLACVDAEWKRLRVKSGLSSGEGLIWHVRDPIEKSEPVRENKRITGYQQVIVDQGEDDKRLLVVESEFASALKVATREGNTLSTVLRQCWDGGDLNILTKNSPAKATAAHVSIVGHITRDEYLRHVDRTEILSGSINRVLNVCVKRSKVLPEGGNIRSVDFRDIDEKLQRAVNFGKAAPLLEKAAEAKDIWAEVYPELSGDRPGLLGAATARAEAQVMRLAALYAVLDMSTRICSEHLLAALACWEYAEASARYVFGDAIGDPIADQILSALRQRPEGITRTQIRDMFGRNQSRDRIQSVLVALESKKKIRRVVESDTGGRPVERWFVSGATT